MSFVDTSIARQISSVLNKRYVESNNDREEFYDVPTVTDDDEYKTHVPLESEQLAEAEDEEKEEKPSPPEKETPVEPEAEETPAEPSEAPDMGGMPGMGGEEGGMGGILGMGEEDEGPKTPREVGRVYELKKIYARLIAIESHLNTTSEEVLIKLRNFVSQAIDLFKTLISNVDLFKDRIDDILVTFYKFVEHVYEILRKYYETKKRD